jgi:hypothetical protein
MAHVRQTHLPTTLPVSPCVRLAQPVSGDLLYKVAFLTICELEGLQMTTARLAAIPNYPASLSANDLSVLLGCRAEVQPCGDDLYCIAVEHVDRANFICSIDLSIPDWEADLLDLWRIYQMGLEA